MNCISEVTTMNKLLKTGLMAILFYAATATLADRPLKAQSGCWGGGWGYGYGAWSAYDYPYGGDHIPFYALHPPVYYSRIVPRAMGWTPFAYSPDAIVLPLDDGGPKQIINPFVPPSNEPIPTPAPGVKAKPSADKTAADSDSIRVILNPYVGTTLASRVD
jgi:hypothetical protein